MQVVVGPGRPCISAIGELAESHPGGRLFIAAAWARDDGVGALLDVVDSKLPEVHVLVGLNERGTTVEALLRLLPATATLHVFFKHPRQTFHPKLYFFESEEGGCHRASLLVGSSNLTYGGLLSNIEASVSSTASGLEAEELALQVHATWTSWLESAWAHPVTDVDKIRELYDFGYLSLEQSIRREGRRRTSTGESEPLLPTAPPPKRTLRSFSKIEIPFKVRADGQAAPPDAEDPPGVRPLPGRFFVRTLTDNDLAKLQGARVGTFEPDLGETARDKFPAFWGWTGEYATVTHRSKPREEWSASALIISSVTDPKGADIHLRLWFRAARPGHAAEHRMQPGPIKDVRAATPPGFDGSSLVIIERSSPTHDFVLRLVTRDDPGYDDFEQYLTEERPHHHFGYGP